MICEDVDRHRDAYIDRELPEPVAAEMQAHLRSCESCRQRVADREALSRLVRSSAPYYEAPPKLRARAIGQTSRPFTRRIVTWAAAAVVVLGVGAGMAVLRTRTASSDTVVVAAIIDSHVRSLMADHLFDVRSTDQHTVKPWFLGKLDFSPPVVDLAPAGFPLVGGRLDYVSGRPVAALVYQRQQHTINVFIWPATGSIATSGQTVRGFHVRQWIRDGMSFSAVSDLNETELAEFTRALQGT